MIASQSAWSAVPVGERQLKIKGIVVEHDRYREAFEGIRSFHYPVVGGVHDSGSVAVLAGDSRTGKTFAARRYMKAFPPSAGDTGMIFPVVYADMPIDGGCRGLLESLADALQMKHSSRMNSPTLMAMILKALVDRRVELLLLDEFQEVFRDDNKRLLSFGRGLVRKILNLRTLNIICIGLVDTYRLMQADEQLTGRGGLPYRMLRPYSWDSEEERACFRLLCDEIDGALPFNHKSGLRHPQLAQRLYWATQGNIGRLMDFLFYAGCLAINDGADQIETHHFAQTYDYRKPPGTSFNPFLHDLSQAPKPETPKPRRPGMTAHQMFSKSSHADVVAVD